MRRRLAAGIVTLVLIIGMGGFLVYNAYSQSADVVTVNGQRIPVTLYDHAQTEQAVLTQRYPGYMKHVGDINTLIKQVLIDQEATRRGIACSAQDSATMIATQVAMANQAGRLGDMLSDADHQGITLPLGYLTTPEAQRTPSTADAVATWITSPDVIKGYQEICTTTRLYSAVTPPNATNDQRNAAINGLLARLRAAAKITSSGSVPVNSPTPYNRPVLPAGAGAIAVGAPTLVGGAVRVPVSTTGTGLTPYTGFSVHLRWDPSVFGFSSASSAGTILPGSPFCPAAQVDADGAGVVFACAATGGNQTTTAGLLATIVLTPAGVGCSPLHLFTYGGADNGDGGTGTYTIDAATNIVVTVTADGSGNQAGQVC